MITTIPQGFAEIAAEMAHQDAALRALLIDRAVLAPERDTQLGPPDQRGAAAARAYPIQGILKYHGMSDWDWRIAYLPSISLNNDAAYTLTRVVYDPALDADQVTINEQTAVDREFRRVVRTLDEVRRLGRFQTFARVDSKNITRAAITGKGLGTSASASAALALAALAAAFGPDVARNAPVVSRVARLLAGSGCRSVVGGLGLWLSYPGIPQERSYALRLDQRDELADLALVTVPIPSRLSLKTEQAHIEAPQSPLFQDWMRGRQAQILECLDAVRSGDWRTIAQFAELDSIHLHAITMTASKENKLFAWEPENITLFRMCNALRSKGIPVYFSTDTGPTTVLLTCRQHRQAVADRVRSLGLGLEAVEGAVAGPAMTVPLPEADDLL